MTRERWLWDGLRAEKMMSSKARVAAIVQWLALGRRSVSQNLGVAHDMQVDSAYTRRTRLNRYVPF